MVKPSTHTHEVKQSHVKEQHDLKKEFASLKRKANRSHRMTPATSSPQSHHLARKPTVPQLLSPDQDSEESQTSFRSVIEHTSRGREDRRDQNKANEALRTRAEHVMSEMGLMKEIPLLENLRLNSTDFAYEGIGQGQRGALYIGRVVDSEPQQEIFASPKIGEASIYLHYFTIACATYDVVTQKKINVKNLNTNEHMVHGPFKWIWPSNNSQLDESDHARLSTLIKWYFIVHGALSLRQVFSFKQSFINPINDAQRLRTAHEEAKKAHRQLKAQGKALSQDLQTAEHECVLLEQALSAAIEKFRKVLAVNEGHVEKVATAKQLRKARKKEYRRVRRRSERVGWMD